MNLIVQKYGPPIAVLGAALYLGWPPSRPLDLGDEMVTAKSIRWKTADLESPRAPVTTNDPFKAVLVVKAQPQAIASVAEALIAEAIGPTDDEIRAVVVLTGIAQSGGRDWAILNGKVFLPGDVIKTNEKTVPECTLISVNEDHVVVSCQSKQTVIRPLVSQRAAKKTNIATITQVTNQAPATAPTPPEPPAPDASQTSDAGASPEA